MAGEMDADCVFFARSKNFKLKEIARCIQTINNFARVEVTQGHTFNLFLHLVTEVDKALV